MHSGRGRREWVALLLTEGAIYPARNTVLCCDVAVVSFWGVIVFRHLELKEPHGTQGARVEARRLEEGGRSVVWLKSSRAVLRRAGCDFEFWRYCGEAGVPRCPSRSGDKMKVKC